MTHRYDLFLSYSRRDIEIMQRVCTLLRAEGLKVWTDEILRPGTLSWKDEVELAIETSRSVVTILSPAAKQSVWVKNEIDYAIVHGLRIFPILARGDMRTSILITLIGTHYIDIREEEKNGLAHLTIAVQEFLGNIHAIQRPTETPPDKRTLHIDTKKSTSDIISIVIVDDTPITRESIKDLFRFEDDMKVVGEAATGKEAVTLVSQLQPNIVLMDINMPDMDGIEATTQIFKAFPKVAVIMTSYSNLPEDMTKAMLAGARLFLNKPLEMDELFTSIRRVYEITKKQF
jgi:CheY-like chemotaxis protein